MVANLKGWRHGGIGSNYMLLRWWNWLDTSDLSSDGPEGPCGFESHSEYVWKIFCNICSYEFNFYKIKIELLFYMIEKKIMECSTSEFTLVDYPTMDELEI